MKKFLFGLIATVLISGSSFGQTRTSSPGTQKIHIEFGRVSKACGGFGICIFQIDITIEDVLSIINAIQDKNGKLKIQMTPEFYGAHKSRFTDNIFVVEENFVLNTATARALGYSNSYTIAAGRYNIAFDSSSNTYNCTF